MDFQYRLKRRVEKIGALKIELECLDNLDHAIDSVFDQLQGAGQEKLLEKYCPYFGVIWPSGRALAQVLESAEIESVRGKKVLELGCGLGLPSLVAAKLGAQVTATDFHPEVPRLLRSNMRLNEVVDFELIQIDWESHTMPNLGHFDWVIASDVLYERHHPELVARITSRYVDPDNGRILLADPGRPYLQSFVDEMKKRNFSYETDVRKVYDDGLESEIFLISLR